MSYIEYTSRNLSEYTKIKNTILSATNKDHFEVVKCMVNTFVNNCNFRSSLLKKIAICNILSFNHWREYKLYHDSASEQLDSLTEICSAWVDQYNEWMNEQKQDELDKELKSKKRVKVVGFSSLFKINKRKK